MTKAQIEQCEKKSKQDGRCEVCGRLVSKGESLCILHKKREQIKSVSWKQKCAKIAHHYGQESQLCILQEECAELIQAASKIRRDTPDAFDKYIDELADVSIMIEQMKVYMDDDELTTLSKRINEKLERQLERMQA